MHRCVAARNRPSSVARVRPHTLLLSAVVFTASLALPATLVSAQEAPPPPDGSAAQTTTFEDAQQAATDPASATGSADTTPTGQTVAPAPVTATRAQSVRAAGSASVSARDNLFAPPSLTIDVGDTVTWSNDGDNAHTVTANGGGFDSGNLDPGQSFSHSFSEPGTFPYYCQYHRSAGMTGTIKVLASSSGGGGGGAGASGGAATGTTPTGPGSESAAGASPGAAGSATQLPSTGLPLLPLAATGLALLALGALLRRRARISR